LIYSNYLLSQENINLLKTFVKEKKMNTFASAVQNSAQVTTTTNGAVAFTSTRNAAVDLFFNIGAARNSQTIVQEFMDAFTENETQAMKILFWSRDVRGGAGERETFRKIMRHLEKVNPDAVIRNMGLFHIYGRWDDALIFETPYVQNTAFEYIKQGLAREETSGLAGKWCPRQGPIAAQLRKYLGMTPKQYRKYVVSLTNVVEQKMCSKNWSEIDFEHIPSIAAARYKAAFLRNTPETYNAYKKALVSGEAKINASAIFPHDVIKQAMGVHTTEVVENLPVIKAQWDALPNYLGDNFILPLVDVSGSMTCPAGGKGSTTCMDISVALGLYLADKQQGAFAGMFMTFTNNPQLQKLEGNIIEKVAQLQSADWAQGTNIEAAFHRILKVSLDQKVAAEEMPKILLILSDMQFDRAMQGGGIGYKAQTSPYQNYSPTGMDMLKNLYAQSGYQLPKVVFWNINGAYGNFPITVDEHGTAMVSGFSPSILKSILSATEFTPESIMNETILSERYAKVL
jgi:hypothetical protein